MKSETGNETFIQTRSTWLTLTGAGLLWAAACLWAFSAVDFEASADRPDSAQEAAMLALEAEEQVRLEAQEKAAERRQRAAAEESRQAALRAKALAEQNASSAAEAEAAEAAEKARLALEAKAAEAARLVSQAEAAEKARVALEAKAAVEEAAKAEAAAESAAQQERTKEAAEARQLAALTSQRTEVDEKARQAAAAEASRIAALARQQRNYTRTRDQELRVLAGLSARLRFTPESAAVSRQIERTLDDIFNPLYLYSEAYIRVSVATNEYDGTTKDGLLSRDRGRAIASYLINRGLEKERFRIHIETGEQLPTGTHRIRVSAEEVRK